MNESPRVVLPVHRNGDSPSSRPWLTQRGFVQKATGLAWFLFKKNALLLVQEAASVLEKFWSFLDQKENVSKGNKNKKVQL